MRHIMKCPKCGKYSMQEKCPRCTSITERTGPAKWSPEDLYGKYRREAKLIALKGADLL